MTKFYRETALFDGTIITQESEYSWGNETPTAKDLNMSAVLNEKFLSIKDKNSVQHIIRVSDISNIRIFEANNLDEEKASENVEEPTEDDIPF